MAAGNVPDILIGSDEVNMTSFAAKNILTDLTSYFDKDEDINREDYFENILSAMKMADMQFGAKKSNKKNFILAQQLNDIQSFAPGDGRKQLNRAWAP